MDPGGNFLCYDFCDDEANPKVLRWDHEQKFVVEDRELIIEDHENESDEKEQQKFIRNYENGMVNFEQNFKKNLQYLLLLPEIYSIIFPPNQHFTFLCSQSELNSRIVEGMEYQYQLKLVKHVEEQFLWNFMLYLTTEMKSLKNSLTRSTHLLRNFRFLISNFRIEIKYVFEKLNSKIISGELKFIENLHDHLSYSITMNLNESMKSVM